MFQKNSLIKQLARAAGNKRLSLLLASVLFAGLALGCSRERFPKDPNMVPLAGIVTIDGTPTQYIKVIVATSADIIRFKDQIVTSGKSSGITDEHGAFSITTVHLDDGVLPGDYKVIFEWMPPGVGADLFEDGIPPDSALSRFPPKLVAIHEKYAAMKPGIMDLKVEAKKPQKELKFDLTTQ